MIRRINFNGENLPPRKNVEESDVDAVVRAILDDVKRNGDDAVIKYTKRFDCPEPGALEVTREEIAAAEIDPALLASLKLAAENIRSFHENQKRTGFIFEPKAGVVTGQRITPLERVGLYIPGGTARYPSSVLMNAIPAKLAGVDEIIMVTPPSSDGTVPSSCLAAAAIAGVDRVFKMGGAQAVAALAFGTQSVPRVDKIVGPGNVYVAAAKRMVYGTVDIDMIAGPSDILIIADETANAAYAAADMLGQSEHDVNSAAVLICTSSELADNVAAELEKQLETLPRKDIASRSIAENGIIIVVKDLETAVRLSNEIAPEHLELCVNDPWRLMPLVRNAGSIFLGHYTPEALGDYIAGPNHTLPTSGTARFSSPLSVDDFCKKSSFLYYSRAALNTVTPDIARIARGEGLDGHARSAEVRL